MKRNALSLAFYLFLIVGLPRLISLDAHWSNDETLWLYRSAQFMNVVRIGQFEQTLIAHHPGVTTMWLGGLRQFFGNTEMLPSLKSLAMARWFICAAVSIGLTTAFFLLRYLFGTWQATVAWGFLASNPFLLSQTRRVHTDALATIFILLTVLLFLLFCITPSRAESRSQKRGYLIFAGIAFGFACLSKSYSLILLSWLPFCLWFFRPLNIPWRDFLHSSYITGIFFLSYSLLTIFGIWPIFWHPLGLFLSGCLLSMTVFLTRALNRDKNIKFILGAATLVLFICAGYAIRTFWLVLDSIEWALTTPHEINHYFLGKSVEDPGWLFYFFTLSIKSTPFVLPLAVVSLIFLCYQRRACFSQLLKVVLAIGTVVILFIVFLSITSKKFPRYLLPIFPMIDILAGIGLYYTVKWIGARFKKQSLPRVVHIGCIAFVFLLTVIPVFALHPYYGTYYNPCWKMTDITKIITVSETSGLELAARYLNKKSNASQLRVHSSPLGKEFLQYYFVGTTYHSGKNLTGSIAKYLPADYEVVFIRDLQIGSAPQAGIYNGQLEHVITHNGLDLAWIYLVPSQEE